MERGRYFSAKGTKMKEEVKCPISGKPMRFAFSETILNVHEVNYYYCKESGLLKTEKPYWLDKAYHQAITDTDIGLVNRNINNSKSLEFILECLSLSEGKLLDVAGGYGLLTRLLRDKGFDCYTIDKYCENLFAKTFEPDSNFKADALFAFEVLEHIEDPFQFLCDVFEQYNCNTIIFSTLTFTDQIPSNDWWYYAFETGQHITFYQPRTLSLLAERLDCNYYMIYPNFHIITGLRLSNIRRLILLNKYYRKLYAMFVGYKRSKFSKTWDDHLIAKERLNQANKALFN